MADQEWKPTEEGLAVGSADGFVQLRYGPKQGSKSQPRIDLAYPPEVARELARALLRAADKAELQRRTKQ